MLRSFVSVMVLASATSCANTRGTADGSSQRSPVRKVAPATPHESPRSWIEGDAYLPEKTGAPDEPEGAWKTLVAFVYPNTGNSFEESAQPSQSHFRKRRSRVTVDGRMSYAELLLSARSADFEALLKPRGLSATFLKTAPNDPGRLNTIVEVCTYLDEEPQPVEMGPLDMTIETVYYVRILQPEATTRISTGPVQVHKTVRKSNFSSWDIERYVGALMKAQSAAQVRLVDWVADQLKE